MSGTPIRSILVATDLGEGSDGLVRSAAALAGVSGAELHVLHVLELDAAPYGAMAEAGEIPSYPGRIERAEEALAEQVRRVVPARVGARPRVVNYVAHRAITEEAADLGVDLIVLGAHRGGEVAAEILGSTADRVIRTAEVPCLVLRRPLSLPLRRLGVPVDFSEPSRAALRVAGEWVSWLGGGDSEAAAPELHVLHVDPAIETPESPAGADATPEERLAREAAEALPALAGVPVRTAVRREPSPAAGILSLARELDLDLLVMGTHGRGGLSRLLIGSVASGIARKAPCPVLLVPPAYPAEPSPRAAGSGESGTRSRRVRTALVAVDLSEASVVAADWSVRHFAPDAEHLFVHVLHHREPPAFLGGPTAGTAEEIRDAEAVADERLREFSRSLTGRESVVVRKGSPAEEIAGVARERGVDLVVVGPHARHGVAGWLGSTAESLLGSSPAPVLLARDVPPGPPSRILAAVDESDRGVEVLALARTLKERFGASLDILYVFDLPGYLPALELVGTPQAPTEPTPEARGSALKWLRERALQAGIAEGEASVRTEYGEPGDVILDTASRDGAELIVMGSRGAGRAGRLLLGSVAGRVLRHAPCPVLVVADPARGRRRR